MLRLAKRNRKHRHRHQWQRLPITQPVCLSPIAFDGNSPYQNADPLPREMPAVHNGRCNGNKGYRLKKSGFYVNVAYQAPPCVCFIRCLFLFGSSKPNEMVGDCQYFDECLIYLATFEVVLEFPLHITRQGCALGRQLLGKCRVVLVKH